jgi:seryl-tRNA synthetase
MERYSMNEFKPLTLLDKRQRIEERICEIETKRYPLVLEKQEIESKISDYNRRVRGKHLETAEYDSICRKQRDLFQQKRKVERELMELNQQARVLSKDKDDLSLQIKKIPDEAAKQKVVELRDKYSSFASDTTRVSSMRAMASKFVEEMQSLLKEMI